MDILSLLPMLLKVLPFAAIGALYALWRWAATSRDKAREERDSYAASYELAEEVAEIDTKEDSNVAEIENMDLSGVIDVLHGVVRDKSKD